MGKKEVAGKMEIERFGGKEKGWCRRRVKKR